MVKQQIRFRALLLAVTTAAVFLVPMTGIARAEMLVFHYVSPFLNAAAGNTAISSVFDGGSGIPNDHTVCFSYGLGGSALSQPIPWSVSDL